MKTLKIEWKHLETFGDTCDRCYETGENLVWEIKRLNRALLLTLTKININSVSVEYN